jgi:hypothetical protein
LRKFALGAAASIVLFSTFASSQQIDIAVGGATALASKNTSSSEAFQPLAEKGGTYAAVSADMLLRKRFGLNVETSWRFRQGNYNGAEKYRPILTDVNALYQPKLSKKAGLDLMAGIGLASNRFYLPGNISCGPGAGTCFVSSNHFMEHISAGFRYYFFHHFFLRPEIHYYHIQNNFEFRSDNLFRAGASIGYTFGSR